MEPWIIDEATDPKLARRLKAIDRDFESLGYDVWDFIGRPEPFRVADHAVFVPEDTLAGPGDDILYGGGAVIDGGAGDDILIQTLAWGGLHGGAGHDFVAGWFGWPAVLTGGVGDDVVFGDGGAYSIYGGGGSNLLIAGGNDDLLSTASSTAWLGGEAASGPEWRAAKALTSDEMHGGDGDDVLIASYGADRLYGGNDDDRLEGQAGDDLLFGGWGADRLFGGDGADRLDDEAGLEDRLYGGNGDDHITSGGFFVSIYGGSGRDVIAGGDWSFTVYGGAGHDRIETGAGDDWIDGGAGADVIRLGAGDDVAQSLDGDGWGDDDISGAAGDDRLFGGVGRDRLDGGDGDDLIAGGAGNDVLTGGPGADRFVFRDAGGVDAITDFGAGDRLQIAAGINGLALDDPAALRGRAFLQDGFAWIDLGGATPAPAPDGGRGVTLAGVDAIRLSDILDHAIDLV